MNNTEEDMLTELPRTPDSKGKEKMARSGRNRRKENGSGRKAGYK